MLHKFQRFVLGEQANLPIQLSYDPLSGITRMRRYQKDKPFWILLKQRWWGGTMAVASAEPYASYLHFAPVDNHASTSSLRFLQAGCSTTNQQRQSTEGSRAGLTWSKKTRLIKPKLEVAADMRELTTKCRQKQTRNCCQPLHSCILPCLLWHNTEALQPCCHTLTYHFKYTAKLTITQCISLAKDIL